MIDTVADALEFVQKVSLLIKSKAIRLRACKGYYYALLRRRLGRHREVTIAVLRRG